ncbi:hypothetical protein BH11GEM1_BH11GEM1_17320 [soil metagenome]
MPTARALLLLLLVVAAGGCSATRMTAPVPTGDLRAAPVTVMVGQQALVLVPSLWRDFQPISPPDGKPLVAVLRVKANDGAALASTFHVDGAWVIYGAEVWTASVGEEKLASPSPVYYEVVARDGPKWGPNVSVDVVVRIREPSGSSKLLRAAAQLIQRTD